MSVFSHWRNVRSFAKNVFGSMRTGSLRAPRVARRHAASRTRRSALLERVAAERRQYRRRHRPASLRERASECARPRPCGNARTSRAISDAATADGALLDAADATARARVDPASPTHTHTHTHTVERVPSRQNTTYPVRKTSLSMATMRADWRIDNTCTTGCRRPSAAAPPPVGRRAPADRRTW